MSDAISFELEVDTSGLLCPLPILRAKKALAQVQSGQVVKVITTDPRAKEDFQAFTDQTGNTLLGQFDEGDGVIHYIRRR
ncbi:MAG TPA: sulfurtransferase TusA family protein [Paenalcaligenes hominis]|uniref:Sulfurtransferase TusA family protein n=1 Tax=Paenalcaligenes hominis TaxID=643674 RepID=A0A1U9JZ23_9BURK|nr:sulfurtransferase TusA family protein [Paenalcaligenes hominis]AQS50969.1 hypothetical protein PAEH1_04195 [Paenalcaligenes hominis]NJB64029.1 tRNA 2-thiouridine synthesizing protein A [Paenalcaligenes hominis]GGE62569.1 hypothetical protein GCM10007278_08520 [Paenalcaligenes hominis]HJH23744.1 sulfurtransferase TusA family protein [Paenalcaligenes hominis]